MLDDFVYDEATGKWKVNPNLSGDRKRIAENLLADPVFVTSLDKNLATKQWTGAFNGVDNKDTKPDQNPFSLNDFIKNSGKWRIDGLDDNLTAQIGNIFNDRVTSTTPQGYNKADTNSIFNSMSDIKGSTFGGAYAALGSYNLMGLNEGMANYAKNEANDPLNKDNLKPFVTTGDSGFANPLAAKYGAIVNYGKVQTEKDEVTVLPDGGIVDSASKSLHKNMDSDYITEYLPAKSIVFSNNTMIPITKFKKDEDDIIASTISNYKETEKPELPKQFRVTDLYKGKKKMSAAKLIKGVRDMFYVKEASDDETAPAKLMPLDIRTNEMNKMARMPYIAAIFDKVKDKMDIAEADTEDNNEDDKPTKAPLGAVIPLIGMGLSAIGTVASQAIADKQRRENMKILEQGRKDALGAINMGSEFALLAGVQDPYIPPREYALQRALINQMPNTVQPYLYESLANQQSADASLRARSLFENTTSFNKAANAAAAYDVNSLKARNDLMTNIAYKNLDLSERKRGAQLNLANDESLNKQQRTLGMIQNANAILSNLGNIGTNWANQKANIGMNYDMGKVGVGNSYANTTVGNIQSGIQNATNMLGFMKSPVSVTNNNNAAVNTAGGDKQLIWRNDPTGNLMRTDATSKMTYNSQQAMSPPEMPIGSTPYNIQNPALTTPDYGYTVPLDNTNYLNANSTTNLQPQVDTDSKSFSKRLSNLETQLGGTVPQELLDNLMVDDLYTTDEDHQILQKFLFNPDKLNSYTPADLNKALARIKKAYKIK